jgi:hypothetical protein
MMSPPEERFWAKVERRPDGCWVWTSTLGGGGYGTFSIGGRQGRQVKAHRFAYEIVRGEIPEGLDLDHLCRVRACVNPDHLEPVTRSENVRRGLVPQLVRERQAAKTQCPRGHPYDEANTYVTPDGRRNCRTCLRAASRAWKARARKVVTS